jgi:hypothetical protein
MRVFSSLMLGSLLALSGLILGCEDDRHHSDTDGSPDQGLSATPQKATIDTGTTLTAKGGDGVGVFVQYATGGHWTLTTACDTNTSGYDCGFDLFVSGLTRDTALSHAEGQSVEPGDFLEVLQDGTLHYQTYTSTGLDGFTFDAPAGAAVELEMYLDGVAQPRFVYWYGDKVLHTGAPTDPIDFAPSAN